VLRDYYNTEATPTPKIKKELLLCIKLPETDISSWFNSFLQQAQMPTQLAAREKQLYNSLLSVATWT